jgi:Flp pilus assembly CpaE family ATPase
MLRLEPRFTSRDLLLAGDRPDTQMVHVALTPYGVRLRILLAPTDEMKKAEGTVKQALSILKLIRRLTDVVVLDVPLTFDELFFRTLEAADQIVILGNATLPELQALQRACEAVRHECHGPQPCPVIVRFDPKTAKLSIDEMSRMVGLSRLRTIASD